MKLYLILSIAFLVVVNSASASVGGAGISDTANTADPWLQQGYSTDLAASRTQPDAASMAYEQQSIQPLQFYMGGSESGTYPQGEEFYGQAPQIRGPFEEQLTPEMLGLSLPQMDGFTPDSSLGFVSASYPGDAAGMERDYEPFSFQGMDRAEASYPAVQPRMDQPLQPAFQTAERVSDTWYYPSSLASSNRFYVQTSSGLRTVGGCGYGRSLPLWADIRTSGNFFVYEWYPGQSKPYVHYLGWTAKGWKKGWFGGDVPGWHILCYNSGMWSNYIYIYVYPPSGPSGYSGSAEVYKSPSTEIYGSTSSAYPAGLTPPSPGGEGLIMPDFNQYPPASQTQASATFIRSTQISSGVISSSPYGAPMPASPASIDSAPAGYMAGGYKAVYPHPSICKCNEYFVQICPGKLDTVAGVFCGDWLPLWSKISRSGDYWSFEWKICGSKGSSFCSPDVRDFGHKGKGWHQTWFKGDDLGWHILSYNCKDWSNYIYIYVWPDD